MKFTEGMWHVKEGVDIAWMGNVERTSVKDEACELLLSKPMRGRGDKLNTPTLTAKLTRPREGIIAAKFTHWAGEDEAGPDFPLSTEKPTSPKGTENEGKLEVQSGPLDLVVNTTPNELSFSYTSSSKKLTSHSFRSIGLVSSRNSSKYSVQDGLYAETEHYILLELDLSVHEKIYGLGERFGPFIKNGQSIDIWNEDGGTSSELTYKNIPFYLSSRGYGVFINNPSRIMLEVQSERTTRVNIAVAGESLEYMIIAGPTPKEILNRYTALTGRPSLPPAWSYGLWLTTSFTTSYTEDTVTSFLDGFKERNIPLTTFHFDSYWMKSFQWCDFTFDRDNFPDTHGYLARLKKRGLKTCVWINPYIAQDSPLFAEGKANGYFLMRADTLRATVWQWDLWQPGMAIVDFTNPDASAWFARQLVNLMEMGIDAFKTDFAERVPFDSKKVRWWDGSEAGKMHNFYSLLYNRCVWETMLKAGKDPCLFARAATTGGQQFPVHWGGDCESTSEAMAETLRGGLSLGLSGFGFWAHDIGGFEGMPSPSVYKRWVQFGLLSSHSRLHGSSSYRVPWIYEGEEGNQCSRVLRDCVMRKLSLMPYLLRCALESKEKGTPVMRAMLLEFPEDHNVWNVDAQFMLGPNLLVAPVFGEDGEVTFYVPRTGLKTSAKWRSWFDHTKTYEEGMWYTETHGFDTLPLLIRPETITPICPGLSTPDGDVLKSLELLDNGPLTNPVTVEIVEPQDVGKVAASLTIKRPGSIIESSGKLPSPENIRITLVQGGQSPHNLEHGL
jgi:alpha-D-xyloside xylohydrolase